MKHILPDREYLAMIDPDRVIHDALNSHTLPAYHWFFSTLTWMGDAGLWLIVLAGCLLLPRWRKIAVVLIIVLAFSIVINTDIKHIAERARPDGTIINYFTGISYSFPSGHTQTAFAIATVLAAFLDRRYNLITYLLAIGVGMSRIYLGVHYFTDVVAGAATGVAIGVLTAYALYSLSLYSKNTVFDVAFRPRGEKDKLPGREVLLYEAVVISAGFLLAALTSWPGMYLLSLVVTGITYALVLVLPAVTRKHVSA